MEQYGKPIGEASYRTVPAEADESEQQPGSSAAAAEIGIKICDFTKQEQGLGKIFLTMLISELFRLGYAKSFWTRTCATNVLSMFMSASVSAGFALTSIHG